MILLVHNIYFIGTRLNVKGKENKSETGKTKSTAATEDQKKGDNSSDSDDGDEIEKYKMNSDEKTKELDTVPELDEEHKTEYADNQIISTLNKNSSLSAKSTRVFIPSVQKSKNKGFEVDENGLLKISGFDDSLNIKFTSSLPGLFHKISKRFKTCPKMDITTYIKTLHNMYRQHFYKSLKKTGEFNDDTSAIIFPQILKFMWYTKCIQGKLLTLIIEDDIFDIKEVEETAKLSIDWNWLLKIYEEYTLNTKN